MRHIPLGKAIVPVEHDADDCAGCFFENDICKGLDCVDWSRADGKNVIFVLVDLPADAEASE